MAGASDDLGTKLCQGLGQGLGHGCSEGVSVNAPLGIPDITHWEKWDGYEEFITIADDSHRKNFLA